MTLDEFNAIYKVHPKKLLPLPWDKTQKKPAEQAEVETLTREERRERIKRLKGLRE